MEFENMNHSPEQRLGLHALAILKLIGSKRNIWRKDETDLRKE